jgi:hypothetical protein
MKITRTILFLIVFLSLSFSASFAQTFDGEWFNAYSTYDEPHPNATGYNTIDVATISQNKFAALTYRIASATLPVTNYIIGYTNADSGNGRMGNHYFSSAPRGFRMDWSSGFDVVTLNYAMDMASRKDPNATPANAFIYVANNDPESNILVFRMGTDSVETTDYRMATNADSLWAIHVDQNGFVYVASIKDTVTASEILVYNPIALDANWGGSHVSAPIQTITLPAPGQIRGITSNPEGTILYISNFRTKEIYCYIGSPVTGYTHYTGFNLQFNDDFETSTT